ncbi:uncharacterized protein MELLADRAFT_101017 [Melampsora larici-populina 98AG31]|uniref:Uncharacterized protein n=1 Tax=Melampsora larici-populina (strain 98AG31 / pathotype 3-4-7) TaxID=747676 RepID=F4R3C8_MELLP|nr:uncharacterized protein MELLADRAFT_101017 [Melampsora larici-populina 98AG31]EGG12607.1 hypothetical protein MELLADRAFT_101017 [Melampsora larici-populina 98AG31]
MSSVTSERPSRSRKEPERQGMCRPSPDSRRRVSIDQIILAKSSNRHKKKTQSVETEDSEDEPVIVPSAQNKQKCHTISTNDASASDPPSSPVAHKPKEKGKKKASTSGSIRNEVSNQSNLSKRKQN